MKGIFIKGGIIPESCYKCELGGSDQVFLVCPFYSDWECNQDDYKDVRHPNCPVREIQFDDRYAFRSDDQCCHEEKEQIMDCKRGNKGKTSTEWYKAGKPQRYCFGWIDEMTDELEPVCKNCKHQVDKANDDILEWMEKSGLLSDCN